MAKIIVDVRGIKNLEKLKRNNLDQEEIVNRKKLEERDHMRDSKKYAKAQAAEEALIEKASLASKSVVEEHAAVEVTLCENWDRATEFKSIVDLDE